MMASEIKETEFSKPSRSVDAGWFLCAGLITALAAFLRFYWLELKPLHHDEGVNGFFLTTLFREGTYHYDPANYHGPTLYYIALAFAKLFGLETVPIRWSVAIFGVLTVVLVFWLKNYIGRVGALFAALFIALSPGMVYISRYFIHEMIFVFLSLAVVVAVLLFVNRSKAGPFAVFWMALVLAISFLPSTLQLSARFGGDSSSKLWLIRGGLFLVEGVLVFLVMRMLVAWDNGRPIYLLLAGSCIALLFATKETAFITLGTMLIACLCVWLWGRIFRREPREDDLTQEKLTWENFRTALGGRTDVVLTLAATAFLITYLIVLFFSSFFTYPEGLKGFFEAYAIWTRTGSKDHTQNGMWAYLEWGMKVEAPILLLNLIGSVIAFIKARHRFAMFAALWGFGLFAAYTIIPYKTPWLALSFLLPMCITAGYGLNEIARAGGSWIWAALALGILASGVLAYQSYIHNFVRYADEDMPYVYAHTKSGFADLVRDIERYSEKSGKGTKAEIVIASPDYWPMVWYLRDYNSASYPQKVTDTTTADVIVIKKNDQDEEAIRKYSANYSYVGAYPLRPGVDLALLVKKSLAGPEGKELYRIEEDQ